MKSVGNQSRATCHSPENVAGMDIRDLSPNDMRSVMETRFQIVKTYDLGMPGKTAKFVDIGLIG